MIYKEEDKSHLVLMPRLDLTEEEIEEGLKRLMDVFDGDTEFYAYIKKNRKYLLSVFSVLDDYENKDDVVAVWHDILRKILVYGKWNSNIELRNELFETFQQCGDYYWCTNVFWKVAKSFLELDIPASDPLFRKYYKFVRVDDEEGDEK